MRLLPAALLAVALLPLPASAAPRPYLLLDPRGDTQLGGTPSDDIVSLTFTSTVSKKTRYWVTTLRLAGAPAPSSTLTYQVHGTTKDGCGNFTLYARARTEGVASYYPCSGGFYEQPALLSITGDSITWTVRLSGAPFKPGTEFHGIDAYVVMTDPVVGLMSPAGYDDAYSDAPYRFGQ